jgi:putative ATP-dependent endonuclease of the OLD family
VRRLLHSQLLPALTAPVVGLVEGPHDLTTYSSATATGRWPLAAAGVRLISADNSSGGVPVRSHPSPSSLAQWASTSSR